MADMLSRRGVDRTRPTEGSEARIGPEACGIVADGCEQRSRHLRPHSLLVRETRRRCHFDKRGHRLVQLGDLLGEILVTSSNRAEGGFRRLGGVMRLAQSKLCRQCDPLFCLEQAQPSPQLFGRRHDEVPYLVRRLSTSLYGPLSSHAQRPERLGSAVPRLWDSESLTRQHGPGGGLGVGGVGFPPAPPYLTVRTNDLDHLDAMGRQMPSEAGPVTAGALDADLAELAMALQPAQEGRISLLVGGEGLGAKHTPYLIDNGRHVRVRVSVYSASEGAAPICHPCHVVFSESGDDDAAGWDGRTEHFQDTRSGSYQVTIRTSRLFAPSRQARPAIPSQDTRGHYGCGPDRVWRDDTNFMHKTSCVLPEDNWWIFHRSLGFPPPPPEPPSPATADCTHVIVKKCYGWSDDHNDPESNGVSPAAHNSRQGVRFSTNDAYLEPNRWRANLTVVGGALVDKVLVEHGRARGVRVRTAQGWTEVEGNEVILCAGAIYSPAILMRSGIGPPDHLREHGISVVRDLPVGSSLNEHPAIDLQMSLTQPAATVADKFAVSCLVRFSSELEDAGRNDMGFGSFNLFDVGDGKSAGLIFVTLFRAFSTGTIRLRSPDPDEDPTIDFNLLSDGRDRARMRLGVERLFQLAGHRSVRSIAAASDIAGVRSLSELPADLDKWMLAHCGCIGHPCGSAPMGGANDPAAVLDAACRVLGIDGLRVADASSMPHSPRANNHLSCVMLAEHLAARMLGR
jgi:hypothetical protein